MEEEKVRTIRDYLQKQFPSASHAGQNDFDRMGHMFIIVTKDHVMLTSISRELIEDNNSGTIISILDHHNLTKLLDSNPASTVIVRSSGAKIEPSN